MTGGYDPNLKENVEHYQELKSLAFKLSLINEQQRQSEQEGEDENNQVCSFWVSQLETVVALQNGPLTLVSTWSGLLFEVDFKWKQK